ncbi:DUF2155 domain-containing protein [Fodinicurvata sp. EGI_FJ10296]|uniref:DUF2155 domain-containing protein n=1 Tax=Fodinicurvata sp. EGI_FJ10296 TaxID=3231908 RepID=UPI00345339E4
MKSLILAFGLSAILAAPVSAIAQGNAPDINNEYAVLQALDKISARVSRIVTRVGEPATFGSLTIHARACRTRPPEETPENAAFLQIVDNPPEEEEALVFSGWMYSSSPAVSALDHPVFDVWVVACADEPPLEDEDFGDTERGTVSLPNSPPLPQQPPEQTPDRPEQ